MIRRCIRCFLLFVVVSNTTDNYVIASLIGPGAADEVCTDECFIPIAIGYKIEILEKIEKPFEIAIRAAVATPVLMEADLLHEWQEPSQPSSLGGDLLYVHMSLQL